MVRHCIAYGCVNRSNKPECSKLSWHSLPINNAKLLRTWLLRMKRKDPPVSKHSYLCSQHFSEDCFKRCVGGKRYLKSGSVPTRFSFSPEEKPKRKAPVDRSAAGETKTKREVKDEVLLNSQSNSIDNLADLESVDIPFQEDGFPSFITDKAEAAKSKEELLIEQLKEKEEEVKRLKECLQVQRKELEEELIEKMKPDLNKKGSLGKSWKVCSNKVSLTLIILRVIQSCCDSILAFQTMNFSAQSLAF